MASLGWWSSQHRHGSRESQVQPCGDESCLSPGSYLDVHLPADPSSPLFPCLLWFGQPSPKPHPSAASLQLECAPLPWRNPSQTVVSSMTPAFSPEFLPLSPGILFLWHLTYAASCCCFSLSFTVFLDQRRPIGLSMVMNAVQCSNHWPCVAVDSWKCGSGN